MWRVTVLCALVVSVVPVSRLDNQTKDPKRTRVSATVTEIKKSIVVKGSLQNAVRRMSNIGARSYSNIVVPMSKHYGLDWRWVTAVIAVESSFDPWALSPRGAVGLMQVTPDLAQEYRIQSHELYEPEKNIRVGVQHLKKLSTRYNGDMVLAVAAYNAGEGAVDRFGGVPPYRETRAFVQKVMAYHFDLQIASVKPAVNLGNGGVFQ